MTVPMQSVVVGIRNLPCDNATHANGVPITYTAAIARVRITVIESANGSTGDSTVKVVPSWTLKMKQDCIR